MGSNRRQPTGRDQSTVRVAGRECPVLERISLGRRTYLVLEKIGHAGRQRFMAFDPHAGPDGDLRALIVVPKTQSARQHVRVLKRISSGNNNLPLILDYQARRDDLFVVTTWVRGPDLQKFLDDVGRGQKRRPSATEAFRLFRGLTHGLSQLHRRHNIVHGDIKPANLILASSPSRLVMIDFGSSWLAERTSNRFDGDGVSRAYSAPELQTGKSFVDFRSDQFSATVLLYELLTLQRPYDNLGGQAGRPEYAARMQDKLVAPSQLSPDRRNVPKEIWRAVDELVDRGLAFDPDRRYATSDMWLDAIDHIHAQLKPRSHLTPLNSRMTRVVDWFARMFRR